MDLDRKQYIKKKKAVEETLREYPYYLISLEAPNLGSPTRWDQVKVKDISPTGSITERYVINIESTKATVNRIEKVLDLLDKESKTIIELSYFRDTYSIDEIIEKLSISRAKFYKLKNKALSKFIVANI